MFNRAEKVYVNRTNMFIEMLVITNKSMLEFRWYNGCDKLKHLDLYERALRDTNIAQTMALQMFKIYPNGSYGNNLKFAGAVSGFLSNFGGFQQAVKRSGVRG